jgi:DNA polymerase III subunit gamma/tau
LLFSGPKGCGKTTLARIIARSSLCESVTDDGPCNECVNCLNDNSFEEIDAASQGTIDKVRNIIEDSDYLSLNGSSNKVYIIDEAQRLSKPAQDAFLKIIESRTIFVILCTTEPHKIQGPIRDRLEEYPIRPPKFDDLLARMVKICQENDINFDEESLKMIIRNNKNTPRSSLISLHSLSNSGDINVNEVKSYFRIDSFELINKLLNTISVDLKSGINIYRQLLDEESPTWIKSNIIHAVISSIRFDIGCPHTYPCSLSFFEKKGIGFWNKFTNSLSSIEKVDEYLLEGLLISNFSNNSEISSVVSTPKSEVIVPVQVTSNNIPKKVEEPVISKSIEKVPDSVKEVSLHDSFKTRTVDHREISIDGVKFTSNESLTSLDGKISNSPHVIKSDPNHFTVELEKSRIPVNEKEFSEIFRGIK